jgi:hypothetical protein
MSKPVDGLYFPDGNVIIEAEGSLFRVYQGFLSARSEVLSGLFSIPQPQVQELVDNCAIVHFPDSAADMTHFLRAIFHSGYFEPYPADIKAPAVFAILRLSHKYDVPYLRNRALQHLAILYPTSLEGLISYTHQMWVNMFIGFATEHDYISIHFAAAQIAHEANAVWLLPAILYWCTMFSEIDELLDGTLMVKEDPESSRIALPMHYGRSCVKFKAIDLDSPLVMNPFFTSRDFDMKGSVCTVPRSCRPYRHKLFVSVIEVSQDGPNIFAFQDAKYWRKFEHKLCTACYQFFKNHYSEARIQFWRELPEKFGLPPWAELRKMKEADLGYK